MTIWLTLFQVFGLLLLSPPCSLGDTGFDASSPTSSSSPSSVFGPTCDFDNTARCLIGASCTAPKTCVCPNGQDGTLHCSDPEGQQAELFGTENTLQSWNSSLVAPYAMACRARITEFVTERPSEHIKCTAQIFGESKVFNEKVLIEAVEIHLKVEEAGQQTFEKGIRIAPGTINQNNYHYEERTKNNFAMEQPETYTELPDDTDLINSGSGMGAFLDDDEDGEFAHNHPDEETDAAQQWGPLRSLGPGSVQDGVLTREVDMNSVAVVSVTKCGMEIRFRAADDELMQNSLNPGLSIAIDPEISKIEFSQPNSYIAGTPLSDINSNIRHEYHLLQEEILLHVSMEYTAHQSENLEGESCSATGFVYRAYCNVLDKKMHALKKCASLMTNFSTRSCLDRTHKQKGGALQIFKMCLWVDCAPTMSVCNTVRSEFEMDNECLDQETKNNILSKC